MSDIPPDPSEYWREQLGLNQRLVREASDNQRRWSAQTELNGHTARVAEEVVGHRRLLEGFRAVLRETFERVVTLDARSNEHGQRLDAHADLIGQQAEQICGLQNSRVTTNRRVTELEREMRYSRANPAVTLGLGLLALVGWLVLSFWLKSWVGDNVRVWRDNAEILWRNHPNFGDATTRIIGAGAAFITGMTIVCLVIDLVGRRQPREPQLPPPPVAEEEANDQEVDEGQLPALPPADENLDATEVNQPVVVQ